MCKGSSRNFFFLFCKKKTIIMVKSSFFLVLSNFFFLARQQRRNETDRKHFLNKKKSAFCVCVCVFFCVHTFQTSPSSLLPKEVPNKNSQTTPKFPPNEDPPLKDNLISNFCVSPPFFSLRSWIEKKKRFKERTKTKKQHREEIPSDSFCFVSLPCLLILLCLFFSPLFFV